jgi:signal transduction histidine kinase
VREATGRGDPVVVTAGSHEVNADVHREFPISHTFRGAEQPLGVLSIEATLDEVYRRLFDTAIVILVSQGAKTFVVSFFILVIVHRLITRHLAATAKLLSGYDLRRSPPPLRLERRPPQQPDELDQLVGAFNAMCASLQTAEGELRDREQQLAHANRVATMGQLSASIAHEVSQPITAAITNADAALRWLGAQPPNLEEVRQSLGRIVQEGHRAGDVVRGIRDLIRKAPPRKEDLAINEAILEVIALTRSEFVKAGVSVQTQLAEGLPLIQGDRIQLQQVILNLTINAVEAMSSTGEGLRCGSALGKPTRAACASRCGILVRDWLQLVSTASSSPFTRPSLAAWEWAYRSAVRLLKLMGDDYGRPRTCLRAPSFNSRCRRTQTLLP